MKCPICGTNLAYVRYDLCECPECLFGGEPKKILQLIGYLKEIDDIIERLENERDYLLNTRKEALIYENLTRLQQVLREQRHQTPSSSCLTVTENLSTTRRLGLMIASLELGAFVGWFIEYYYELASGYLPLPQALLPFMFLFQAMLLLVVSWK